MRNKLDVKVLNIWDLDGTVINSFHRVQPCLRVNGDLDLDKYRREACTHDAIQADTLLPLVQVMHKNIDDPTVMNAIVTARMLGKSDYYFLRRQGMRGRGTDNVPVYSRDTLAKHFGNDKALAIYNMGDAAYKSHYFVMLQAEYPNAVITVFDDHQGVLSAAASMGLRAVDATLINEYLSMGIQLAGEQFADEQLTDDLDIEYLEAKLDFAWSSLTDEEKAEYTTQTHSKVA
jgi:Asp-tRNA(Asn)/Glu-tRNA(Gln) amidotransferase A subunit family amidase